MPPSSGAEEDHAEVDKLLRDARAERKNAKHHNGPVGLIKAVAILTQGLARFPRSHELWFERAQCHLQLKKSGEALGDAKQAILQRPASHLGYLAEGEAYALMDDYARAIESFKKGLAFAANVERLRKGLLEAEAELSRRRAVVVRTEAAGHGSAAGGSQPASEQGPPKTQAVRCRTCYPEVNYDGGGRAMRRREAELNARVPLAPVVNVALQRLAEEGGREALEEYMAPGGEWEREVQRLVAAARRALDRVEPRADGTSCVVIAVDECALSSYPDMRAADFRRVLPLERDWVARGRGVACPAVAALYDSAVARGFAVVFSSDRQPADHDATGNNLAAQGYTEFYGILTRPADWGATAGEHKALLRHRLAADDGLHIVLTLASQDSDVDGGHTGIPVVLPNPLYVVF
eukprot:tig00000821_g4471.t1